MDKKIRAMELMIEKHDSFLKDMDIQLSVERDSVRKHNHRIEILEYLRGAGESARTKMIDDMNSCLN